MEHNLRIFYLSYNSLRVPPYFIFYRRTLPYFGEFLFLTLAYSFALLFLSLTISKLPYFGNHC